MRFALVIVSLIYFFTGLYSFNEWLVSIDAKAKIIQVAELIRHFREGNLFDYDLATKKLQDIAEQNIENHELQHALARGFNILAEKADKTDNLKRVSLYCQSLSEFGLALKQRPFNSSYLLDWANVRQLLGKTTCKLPFTEGPYGDVIVLAKLRSPVDPSVHFSAGLLHYWGGMKSLALKDFRVFLEHAVFISSFQESYIVSVISNGKELEEVVPARFPQVVRWTSIFSERKQRQFTTYKNTFGKLQRLALKQLATDFESLKIPLEVYQQQLVALIDFVATDRTRKLHDLLISSFLERGYQREYSSFFSERSELDELQIIPTWMGTDRRVQKTQLNLWGRNELVFFDKTNTTIGFFLPNKQTVKRIELHGLKGGRALDPATIRVLASNDNQEWFDVDLAENPSSFVIAGRSIVGIPIIEGEFKYWKINFTGTSSKQFSNYLSKIIRVFGLSARGNT